MLFVVSNLWIMNVRYWYTVIAIANSLAYAFGFVADYKNYPGHTGTDKRIETSLEKCRAVNLQHALSLIFSKRAQPSAHAGCKYHCLHQFIPFSWRLTSLVVYRVLVIE